MLDLDSQHTPQERGAGTWKQHIRIVLVLFTGTLNLLCVAVIFIPFLHDGIHFIAVKFWQHILHLRLRCLPVGERLSAWISWRITGSNKLNPLQFDPSLV